MPLDAIPLTIWIGLLVMLVVIGIADQPTTPR